MGVSIGWLAVRGKDADTVLGALDLVRNGSTESHPRRGYAITLPSGWFVVVTRFASPLIAEESLRPLSRGCTVVTLRAGRSAAGQRSRVLRGRFA